MDWLLQLLISNDGSDCYVNLLKKIRSSGEDRIGDSFYNARAFLFFNTGENPLQNLCKNQNLNNEAILWGTTKITRSCHYSSHKPTFMSTYHVIHIYLDTLHNKKVCISFLNLEHGETKGNVTQQVKRTQPLRVANRIYFQQTDFWYMSVSNNHSNAYVQMLFSYKSWTAYQLVPKL